MFGMLAGRTQNFKRVLHKFFFRLTKVIQLEIKVAKKSLGVAHTTKTAVLKYFCTS